MYERGVDTRRHVLGELRDGLRMQRIVRVGDDDAVLAIVRPFARDDHVVAVGRRHHVVDRAGVHDDRVHDRGSGGIADVDRVHAVATQAGAEVGDLAVGVNPDFSREEGGARHASDDSGNSLHVARRDRHHGIGAARSVGGGDLVRARLIGDERAAVVDLAATWREEPCRRQTTDLLAGAILHHGAKANDVAGACLRGGRRDLDVADVGRDDLDRQLARHAASRRGENRTSRRERRENAASGNASDLRQ